MTRSFRGGFGKHIYYLRYNDEEMASCLRDLAPGMMRCNRTVGMESSEVFYGQNTFSFEGDHEWIPVITWLNNIGMYNKSLLRKLTVSVKRPKAAWQRADGSRIRGDSREFFPRHASLTLPKPVIEGEVENINPALETLFASLGHTEPVYRSLEQRLTITMIVEFNLIPGVVAALESRFPSSSVPAHWDGRYMGMDMPNLVEKWRAAYCSTANGLRATDVEWQVETEKIRIDEKKAMMCDRGWEIISEEPAETLEEWCTVEGEPIPRPLRALPFNEGVKPSPRPTVRFRLRRKELVGPVIAWEPNPYSEMEMPISNGFG